MEVCIFSWHGGIEGKTVENRCIISFETHKFPLGQVGQVSLLILKNQRCSLNYFLIISFPWMPLISSLVMTDFQVLPCILNNTVLR